MPPNAALQHQVKYTNQKYLCQIYKPHYCTAISKSRRWNQLTVVIKKYGNRRLYDTAGSRYVNLDDIEQALARTRKAGRAAEPEPALT
jgi:hypothetical protein